MSRIEENLRSFERKQYTVSALLLLIFCGLAIIENELVMVPRAEQAAKILTHMIQIEDFREVAVSLELARLDTFSEVRYESDNGRKNFVFPPEADYRHGNSTLDKFIYSKLTIVPQGLTASSKQDRISFSFNRLTFIPYALALWLLLNIVSIPQTRFIKRRIKRQYENDLKIEKEHVYAEIANTVCHDIRTPLSALIRMSDDDSGAMMDHELTKQITNQIKALVAKLDPTPPSTNSQTDDSPSFGFLLRTSAAESKLAHLGKTEILSELDDSLHSAMISVEPHELRSVISNIVNNAVEAMNGEGTVIMRAKDLGAIVRLEIQDQGCGIPEDLLGKVRGKDFTRKPGGTGRGLFHADECLLRWGGRLEIQSSTSGTTVLITLPIQGRAPWYVPRVKIGKNDRVVALDDQVSMHRLLKMRLDEEGFTGEFYSFLTSQEAASFLGKNEAAPITHYFVDFDLGSQSAANGIVYLQTLAAGRGSRYLLTGHFDDIDIQKKCTENKLFLIPKTDLNEIAFVI